MPFIAFGLRRAIVQKLMPKAFKAGMTRTAFYNKMKSEGLGYAKSKMLADWRTLFNIEAKKDALKHVRKDRLPSPRIMAEVTWKYDKEFIYKAKTWSRIHPEAPLTEQMVTFTSDKSLTPREVEEQIGIKWPEWDSPPKSLLEEVHVTSVYHRIPSPLEEE